MQVAVRAGLELGASELQVQRSNHSATPPTFKNLFEMKNQVDFYVRRKLTFSYQARTNCYVQISLNIYTSQNLIVIFTTRHSLFPLRADLGHSITYLRCFDTNFRRPGPIFFNRLKRDFILVRSLRNFHQ